MTLLLVALASSGWGIALLALVSLADARRQLDRDPEIVSRYVHAAAAAYSGADLLIRNLDDSDPPVLPLLDSIRESAYAALRVNPYTGEDLDLDDLDDRIEDAWEDLGGRPEW